MCIKQYSLLIKQGHTEQIMILMHDSTRPYPTLPDSFFGNVFLIA